MVVKLNEKGEFGICSSISDLEQHEKFKKQKLDVKLESLEKTLKTKSVRSKEFYNLVKAFVLKTLHRYVPYNLMEMHSEDLLNNTFIKLIIAFEGGYQVNKRGKEYKEAYYDPEKCKNLGNFIFTISRNEATRFLTTQKKFNVQDDIDDHLNKNDSNELEYNAFRIKNVPYELPYKFKYFEFNESFNIHLENLKMNQPKNNILYNLIMWGESKC